MTLIQSSPDHDELVELIGDAIARLDNELGQRLNAVTAQLAKQAALMDELERRVNDVPEDALRAPLIASMARLDSARADLEFDLPGIATYDLFDPLRILMADIRSGL